jgi:hypothetical protein
MNGWVDRIDEDKVGGVVGYIEVDEQGEVWGLLER